MTKHNKDILKGGSKTILKCSDCDYTTLGSTKDAKLRFKLHKKTKHNTEINTVFKTNLTDICGKNFNSTAISSEMMDALRKQYTK